MSAKKLTPEQEQEIVAAAMAGARYLDLLLRYRISECVLQRVLRQGGVPKRQTWPSPNGARPFVGE